MSVTLVDNIALAIIIYFGYRGYKKGLIAELFKIFGLVFGIIFSLKNVDLVSRIGSSVSKQNPIITKMLGIGILVLGSIILFSIFGKIIKSLLKDILRDSIDKPAGIVFGAVKGVVILSSFLPLLAYIPGNSGFSKNIQEYSYFYNKFHGLTPKIFDSVGKYLPGEDDFDEILSNTLSDYSGIKGFDNKTIEALRSGEIQNNDLDKIYEKYNKVVGTQNKSNKNTNDLFKKSKDPMKNLKDATKNPLQSKEIQDLLKKYQKTGKK